MKNTVKILVLIFAFLSLVSCRNDLSNSDDTSSSEHDYLSEDANTTSPKINDDTSASEHDYSMEDANTTALKTSNDFEYTTVYIDKSSLPEYVPGSVKLMDRWQPFGPETGIFKYERKYRLIYYSTTNFDELIIPDSYLTKEFEEWSKVSNNDMHGKEFDEMELVRFIKYFNIPKEAFDARIEYLRKRTSEFHSDPTNDETYVDQSLESAELPNSDILYTFDNEIINRYYRYE